MGSGQGDIGGGVVDRGEQLTAQHITIPGADGTEIACEIEQADGRVQLRFRMGGGVHVQMGPVQIAVAIDASASVTIDTTTSGAEALGRAVARLPPSGNGGTMTPSEIDAALARNAWKHPSSVRGLARAAGMSEGAIRYYLETGKGQAGEVVAAILARGE